MDFQVLFSSLVLLFPFVFVLWRILTKSGTKSLNRNPPPGPWKLPIIGNIHQLIGSLPHHRLCSLAKIHGPLMSLQLGEVHSIVISSPEVAKEVMKTHDIIFAQRPFHPAADIMFYNSTDIAFSPYGGYWRQLRKICILELLSAKRVQSFRPIREEEASNLVGSISSSSSPAGSPVNLSMMVSASTYSVTSRAAFGKIHKKEREFVPLVREIMEVGGGFSVADMFPSMGFLHRISGVRARVEKLHREMDQVLDSIIEEHRYKRENIDNRGGVKTGNEDEADDLVDVLLNLQDHYKLEFPLTVDNIKAVIMDVFIGGSETVSTAIEWAMSEMLRNTIVLEKAQAEVRQIFGSEGRVDEEGLDQLMYLKLVIKETFRLHPPLALLLPRESRDGCEINGHMIPPQSKVIVNAWAIGRDPGNWMQPDRFNPERFADSKIDYKGTDFDLIPFGAGRRMCPGMLFGIANIELVLASLLFHFDWKLPKELKPESLDMDEAFGATVRRKNDLELIPTPRYPEAGP